MARREKTYRRLPGRARKNLGFFDNNRYRLWLASDHLLYVCRKYFSESYRRFFFEDIQALVISRTTKGRTLNIILAIFGGFLGLLWLLGAVFWGWSLTPLVFLGMLAGTFLGGILYNTILGPTCVCRMHTAVQIEDLYSLGRLRTAQRTIAILKPLIDAAQGELTPEELDLHSEDHVEVRASAHVLPSAAPPPAEMKHEHGRVHAVVFYFFILFAISFLIDVFYRNEVKDRIDLLFFLPFLVLIAVALGKQYRSDLPSLLKDITWAALFLAIGSFLFGIAYSIIYMISHPEQMAQGDIQGFFEGPVSVAFCAVMAIFDSTLGVLGLMRLHQFRAEHAASQVNPSDSAAPERDL